MHELHNAARNGDLDALQQYVATNADLNERDQLSRTPLHLAAWSGQTEAVKMLLAHNVQLNAAAADDMNALHFSASKGHAEVAKLIIAAGLHVDSRTRKGMTPLAMAVQGGHVELASVLLKKKANPHATNKRDESVLDLCKTGEMRALVENAFEEAEALKVLQAEKAAERAQEGDTKKRERGNIRGGRKEGAEDPGVQQEKTSKRTDGDAGSAGISECTDLKAEGDGGLRAVVEHAQSERAAEPVAKKPKIILSFGDED